MCFLENGNERKEVIGLDEPILAELYASPLNKENVAFQMVADHRPGNDEVSALFCVIYSTRKCCVEISLHIQPMTKILLLVERGRKMKSQGRHREMCSQHNTTTA